MTVQGLAFFFESKVRGLLNPVSNYSVWLDGATFLLLVGGGAIALYKGWLTVVPRMRWSLLALVAVALVMPYTLFGSAFADRRLPAAIVFFLLAGLLSGWLGGGPDESQISSLFGHLSLGAEGYGAVVGLVVLVAAVTTLTSRLTVQRTLKSME